MLVVGPLAGGISGGSASIARHLVNFFKEEVAQERMPENLGPLQAGIGNIANAVMMGLLDSDFKDLTMYSEVLQDSTFDLIDAGKLNFASGFYLRFIFCFMLRTFTRI